MKRNQEEFLNRHSRWDNTATEEWRSMKKWNKKKEKLLKEEEEKEERKKKKRAYGNDK